MPTNTNELLSILSRMRGAWPTFAADVAEYPHANVLTMRDLAVLLLVSRGERVSRAAVRNLIGDAADNVIGVLSGHGLLVEDYDEVRLSPQGNALLDDMLRRRAELLARLVDNAPAADQKRFLDAVRVLADAMDAHQRALQPA